MQRLFLLKFLILKIYLDSKKFYGEQFLVTNHELF